MIFEAKPITLKDGRKAILKSPCVEDAEGMLDYIRSASGETEFLLRYPEEWSTTPEQEAEWIRSRRGSPNILDITCYVDGEIAGNCELSFRTGLKCGHRAGIAIAIRKAFWGLGIGSAMFEAMIAAAKERGCALLELEYIEGNDRGRHLYEKFGFHAVCIRPDAFRLKDGSRRSEIFMQKYL